MGSSQSTGEKGTSEQVFDKSEASKAAFQDCKGSNEDSTQSRFHSLITQLQRTKELEELIGKLQHLPRSAQRLFSLSEAYLANNVCAYIPQSDSCLQKLSVTGSLPNDTDGSEGLIKVENLSDTNAYTEHKYKEPLFVPLVIASHLSKPQTFSRWKHTYTVHNVYPFVCRRKPNVIYLQPIDDYPTFIQGYILQKGLLTLNFFEVLQGFMQIFFSGLEVLVRAPAQISTSDKVQSRTHELTGQHQLCVNDIYPELRLLLPSDGLAIIGVSWTDIYPRGFNFTLGEASISHHAAVVSFGRFETKDFNADTNKDVEEVNGQILWKIIKTLTHESCHLLGLEHCLFFRCAMNESSSVSEALQQPLFLCPVCLRKLQQACHFDVLERYEQMHSFLKRKLKEPSI